MRTLAKTASQYLEILNLAIEAPSRSYLEKICTAHLNTFAFENISKLIFFRNGDFENFDIPPYEQFIQNYLEHHYGGTCYTLNSNLMLLLIELGFACYHIMLGKEHMAIIAVLDGEKYYVDCGAAAPFFRPVPFMSNPENVSSFGEDKINLLPVNREENEYKYIRFTNGKQNGITWGFNSVKEFSVSDFSEIIKASNKPDAPFMTFLRCQIWQTDQNRSLSLVNNKLAIRHRDGRSEVRKLSSIPEIEAEIHNEFNLPNLPVRQAIEILSSHEIDIFSE